MPIDPEIAAQISAESRETFSQTARMLMVHAEQVGTGYGQVGVQQQSLYAALSSNMLTGVVNQQANTQQALKAASTFPLVVVPTGVVPGTEAAKTA